ncbi:MAG: DegV family protein [Acidimicrobiia bacterium]|nr:DegV family protein [Acidimicrobiia bacterium]
MAVAIVTDSAAALPADLVARHGITVVPMWLTVGDDSFLDGDRSLGELLGDVAVSTSGPTPGQFAAAIEASRGPDGVLILTIAATMSSTHQSAVLAARSYGEGVRVVDTGTAAGAEALVVLAAAEAAEAGKTLDEVEAVARRAIGEVRLVATVPNLDHLVRSGRVPNVAGWAGRHLHISPLFEFRAGAVKRLRPAFGFETALHRIYSTFARSAVEGASLHVAVLHAMAPEPARRLLEKVTEAAEPDTAFLGEFGSVMVVHTGPGLVGLAWRWDLAGGQAGS